MNADRRQTYKHPPRPEWVTRINAEGRVLGTGVVPLDSDSLLNTACANTGLNDFGDSDPDDHWRAHFEVLIATIEKEAELNLLGRLLTRSDLLIYLQNRLQVTDWYKRHPEIADEVEDVGALAPEAGNLLTAAFPKLSLEEANRILTETEGPGGGFLDDGSAFGVYSRLNLYAAAGRAGAISRAKQ